MAATAAVLPPGLRDHEEDLRWALIADLVIPSGSTADIGGYLQCASVVNALIKATKVPYGQAVDKVIWNHFKAKLLPAQLASRVFLHRKAALGLFIHEDIARDFALWLAECCRKKKAAKESSYASGNGLEASKQQISQQN